MRKPASPVAAPFQALPAVKATVWRCVWLNDERSEMVTSKLRATLMTVACVSLVAGLAWAQQPNFSPAVYGDGHVWGTKGTTELPGPRGNNLQSFDRLFVVVNGAPGQLPVSEAAPGNPHYNGGRWFTYTAMWTEEGIAAHDPLPVLMSYDDISMYESLGQLVTAPGSPAGGPPAYFQCPLLPVK